MWLLICQRRVLSQYRRFKFRVYPWNSQRANWEIPVVCPVHIAGQYSCMLKKQTRLLYSLSCHKQTIQNFFYSMASVPIRYTRLRQSSPKKNISSHASVCNINTIEQFQSVHHETEVLHRHPVLTECTHTATFGVRLLHAAKHATFIL